MKINLPGKTLMTYSDQYKDNLDEKENRQLFGAIDQRFKPDPGFVGALREQLEHFPLAQFHKKRKLLFLAVVGAVLFVAMAFIYKKPKSQAEDQP